MERRDFLATSACALAGLAAPAAADEQQAQKKYALKVTVLKRGFEKPFADAFRNGQGAPCSRVKDGQEFVAASQWSMPAGFCEWAWADIRTYMHDVFASGQATVACCTDGFRPVFFKIERIDA